MHENLPVSTWVAQGDQESLSALLQAFAQQLQGGSVILLHGEMGAGKTTLTRAIARGLGVHKPQRVCSPTYQVAMEHPGPIPLIHVDLFRLGETGVQGELGLSPAMQALGLDADPHDESTGVWVVEWGGYWKDPPAERYELRIEITDEAMLERRVELSGYGPKSANQLTQWAQTRCGLKPNATRNA